MQIAPRAAAQRIGVSSQFEPFGMQVQLHVVATRNDWLDDVGNRARAPDQRGHRVDEEHALDAMIRHHVHLEPDPDRTFARVAVDRARKDLLTLSLIHI